MSNYKLRTAKTKSLANIVDMSLFLFLPIHTDDIIYLISDYLEDYETDPNNAVAICGVTSIDDDDEPFLLPGFELQ